MVNKFITDCISIYSNGNLFIVDCTVHHVYHAVYSLHSLLLQSSTADWARETTHLWDSVSLASKPSIVVMSCLSLQKYIVLVLTPSSNLEGTKDTGWIPHWAETGGSCVISGFQYKLKFYCMYVRISIAVPQFQPVFHVIIKINTTHSSLIQHIKIIQWSCILKPSETILVKH